MSMEDNSPVSRAELVAKANELIGLVSNQSDILKADTIDQFLGRALTPVRVFSYRTYGPIYDHAYSHRINHSNSVIRHEYITPYIDRVYYFMKDSHPLYSIDLTPNSLIGRFKANPNDPVLAQVKQYMGVYITHRSWDIPGHNEWVGSGTHRRQIWVERNAGEAWDFHAPGGLAHYHGEQGEFHYSKDGKKDWYSNISNGSGYTVIADYIGNYDSIAGGPSIRSLLLDHNDSHPAYLPMYFNTESNASMNIDENAIPKNDSIVEDSEMNVTFRALLHILANVRMVSFQKQLGHDWGYGDVGGPINLPISVRNLKNISGENVDSLLRQLNVDQGIIDNKDIIAKFDEIYEIWKNLPRTNILLRYCHDSCHGAGRSRR